MFTTDPEIFKKLAVDSAAWRVHAVAMRSSANVLWESSSQFFKGASVHRGDKHKMNAILDLVVARMQTSQLLYGLATETALKARIIEVSTDEIEFREKKDSQGNIVDIQIMKIGIELGKDGHDLVKLANAVGILSDETLFKYERDRKIMKEILAYLTDCVRWSGRYPLPKKMSEGYILTEPIPTTTLGLHMRDFLDPFLDTLLCHA